MEPSLPARELRKSHEWSAISLQTRPRTASGHQKTARKQPALLAGQLGLHARPSTAPAALLTGEGLLEKRPHNDVFLQHVENKEVQHIVKHQRKERLTQKTTEDEFDLPAGPPTTEGSQLYELILYHGSTQRAHNARNLPFRVLEGSAQRGRNSRLQKSEPGCLSSVGQLHDLATTLDGSIRHRDYACRHLGMKSRYDPHLLNGGAKKKDDIKSDCANLRRLFRSSSSRLRANTLSAPQLSAVRRGAQSRRHTCPVRQSALLPSSLHNVGVILEERYTSFRLAFKAFATDGLLSMGDWDVVLEELAPEVDPADLFRYCNLGDDDCIMLAEFEEAFNTNKYHGSS